MSQVQVGSRAGFSAELEARIGRDGMANITANEAKVNFLKSTMGQTKHLQASERMGYTRHHMNNLMGFVDAVDEYGDGKGWNAAQKEEFYEKALLEVAGGSPMYASSGGGGQYGPFSDAGPASGGFGAGSIYNRMIEKAQAYKYVNTMIKRNPQQFADEMAMSATLPIAKEMIPNTVALKAFITDNCIGAESKTYYTKRRSKAAQFGLGADITQIAPMEYMKYDPLIVTPQPFVRNVMTDMKYIEFLDFDVPSDILTDGGRELQVEFDQTFFSQLDLLIPTGGGSAPLANTTPSGFRLDGSGTVMYMEAGLPPAVEHINSANMILRKRGYRPDLMVLDPFQLAQFMSEQAVLMAYAFGTREVQETGLVGSLMGDAVAWCPNLYNLGSPSSYVVWVVDSDELARVVLGMPITVYPEFDRRQLMFEMYARLTFLIRNANAAMKLVYSNTTSGIA